MTDRLARRWPLGIAVVLALTVAGNAAVYWAANDPHAAAVEPDYYRKAVEWDSTLAQGERNRILRWTANAEVGARTPDGRREISVRLHDAAGHPVAGARIELSAIHNTYANDPVSAVGTTAPDGASLLDLPMPHDGLWELRLVVTRGAQRFTTTLRRDTQGRDATP